MAEIIDFEKEKQIREIAEYMGLHRKPYEIKRRMPGGIPTAIDEEGEQQIRSLIVFVRMLFSFDPDEMIPKDIILEIAVECGLMETVDALGPCCEDCGCEKAHNEFPTQCFRLVDWLSGS